MSYARGTPAGPLGFECTQYKQTARLSMERIRRKALLSFGSDLKDLEDCFGPFSFESALQKRIQKNPDLFEGVVVCIYESFMMFRGGTRKYETTFVKHNLKLVHKCGFRFSCAPSENAELLAQRRKNEVLGPRFQK